MMSAAPPTMAYSWRAAQKLDAALLQTHVLKHFAARWFDRNEISARFPPIAGFRILWLSNFFFSCAWVGFFMGWRRCSCRSRRKLTNAVRSPAVRRRPRALWVNAGHFDSNRKQTQGRSPRRLLSRAPRRPTRFRAAHDEDILGRTAVC